LFNILFLPFFINAGFSGLAMHWLYSLYAELEYIVDQAYIANQAYIVDQTYIVELAYIVDQTYIVEDN
jgi:hypothetical protein